MNVITKDCISENFSSKDLKTKLVFNKSQLVEKINFWKYILKHRCLAVKGESILIGLVKVNTDYIAVCLAAAELSLKIVIVDYSRKDDFQDIEFFDAKTKILSPIDIFIHDIPKDILDDCSKHKFFVNCAKRSFNINEDIDYSVELDAYRRAILIRPEPTDVLMRCTSSGTTGTPKIVEHTHEFLYKLSMRNSVKFYGKCLHIKNLNHGSSLAVYLLPALMSNKVIEHLFFDVDEDNPFDEFVDEISEHQHDLDFVIFPYPFMIDKFIDTSISKNVSWPKLNVQTLSYIQDIVKTHIANDRIKSITSIFGSNETSGPVFENTISKENIDHSSSYFQKLDDFYMIKIDEGLINVFLPVYNKSIITNDIFEKQNEYFIHRGRSDIVKINGETVDISLINKLNLTHTECYLITDSIKNCLYLAFWNQLNQKTVDDINENLKETFSRVKVDKVAVLNKRSFMNGIKIDNELLREYFRNHV